MMSLDEAIKHCEDYLKKRDKDYVHYNVKWLLDNWEQELELLSGGKIRPKGKWIDILDEKTELTETHHTECSICGADGWEEFKYCPKCGAKMELENEKETC